MNLFIKLFEAWLDLWYTTVDWLHEKFEKRLPHRVLCMFTEHHYESWFDPVSGVKQMRCRDCEFKMGRMPYSDGAYTNWSSKHTKVWNADRAYRINQW